MASPHALMQNANLIYDDQRRQALMDMVTLAEQQEDASLNARMHNHLQRATTDEIYRQSGRAFGNPLAFGSPDPYLAHRIGSLGAYNSPLYPGSFGSYGSMNPLLGGQAALARAASMPALGYGGMGGGFGGLGYGGALDAGISGRVANQAAHQHVASCPLSHGVGYF